MTTLDELLPCPFCGCGAYICAEMNTFPDVACDGCGASVSGRESAGAIIAWNRRAEVAALVAKARAEGIEEALDLLRRAARELELIRMKDSGAVYDVMLRSDLAAIRALAEKEPTDE